MHVEGGGGGGIVLCVIVYAVWSSTGKCAVPCGLCI